MVDASRFDSVSVAVVLPTYNEAENLRPMVRRLREVLPDVRIVIADDNSPDGTGRIADECALEFGNIDVLHRPGKQGLGNAYRHGFAHVLATDVDVVVTMDVDFSHDPAVIPSMLSAIDAGATAKLANVLAREPARDEVNFSAMLMHQLLCDRSHIVPSPCARPMPGQ